MNDELNKSLNENDLELTDTVWDDPKDIYGIVEQPHPDDVIYRLDYDKDLRYLKFNTFTIQTFRFESNADKVFGEIFEQEGEVKTLTVSKPAKADVIINNIAMPIRLRNAIFTTGSKGTRQQIHTVITRERAKNLASEMMKFVPILISTVMLTIDREKPINVYSLM